MTTEVEQAEAVIDVFGEAFMKLVRDRLRLQVSTFQVEKGKIQLQIGLYDSKVANGQPSFIDMHTLTITSTLDIKQGF